MHKGLVIGLGLALAAVTAAHAAPTPVPTRPIVGDCDGNGCVTVTDIITVLNAELNGAATDACHCFGDFGGPLILLPPIDCLLRAVQQALTGCVRP